MLLSHLKGIVQVGYGIILNRKSQTAKKPVSRFSDKAFVTQLKINESISIHRVRPKKCEIFEESGGVRMKLFTFLRLS